MGRRACFCLRGKILSKKDMNDQYDEWLDLIFSEIWEEKMTILIKFYVHSLYCTAVFFYFSSIFQFTECI